MTEPEKTADGHYVIIDGRRWRATDPRLSEEERQTHVNALMAARRDVGNAKRRGDEDAVREARDRVHAAKVALGERGPKWWEDEDAPVDTAAGASDDPDETSDDDPDDGSVTPTDSTPAGATGDHDQDGPSA